MKIYYTKNPSGISSCPKCNAKNTFPLKLEENEDGIFKVTTSCKKCKNEIFIKYCSKQEAYKFARNKSIEA